MTKNQYSTPADNYGRRLKTLHGLTPYEFICRAWTKEPECFRLDPSHHMPRPNSTRTVMPCTSDVMVESLRVLNAYRETAVAARRIALQVIHNTIVCAPDGQREMLRWMTRMQLVRTPAVPL